MVRWEMLETKMLMLVKKEARNNNSISRSMRWKVNAELLSSKLNQLLTRKRTLEKRMRN
jgi:hypothetical protein